MPPGADRGQRHREAAIEGTADVTPDLPNAAEKSVAADHDVMDEDAIAAVERSLVTSTSDPTVTYAIHHGYIY